MKRHTHNKKALRLSSQSFRLSRRLPIFTRRFQRTILGTSELNFCVRNGNRWNLTVITGKDGVVFKATQRKGLIDDPRSSFIS